MKRHKKSPGDWLDALTVMGRILLFVPIGVSLVGTLIFALSGGGGLEGSPADAYIMGVIFLCGFVILVYVAIKRFQEGLRVGKEREEQ